jgi:hypothetical protein
MCGPPLGDRVETFPLVNHMRQIDITKSDDLDARGLDDRHRPVTRVDDHRITAPYWEWTAFHFVFSLKTRRRYLVAIKHG